jgi:hypothetical protein
MESLFIKATDDTPKVLLDSEKGLFQLFGRSMPEDTYTFYQPLIDWVGKYALQPNSSSEFHIYIPWFSSASSKMFFEFLKKVGDVRNAKIIWYYEEADFDMEEVGVEFSEYVDNVPFEFKAVQEALMLDGSVITPRVHFDLEREIFSISGTMYTDENQDYYQKIMDWLERYLESPLPATPIVFKLEYATVQIKDAIWQNLMHLIGRIPQPEVFWYYHRDNPDIQAFGEEWAKLLDFPVKVTKI